MTMPVTVDSESRKGLIATVAAFLSWGLMPLYWRLLVEVPALEILAHRTLWCGAFVFAYLLLRRGRGWIAPLLRQPRLLRTLALCTVLITINGAVFLWGVNAGHVVEVSLGYFINPLVSVLLGVMVLRERLNPRQWLAVTIAALGVAYLSWIGGRLPWIALSLAISFGLYGLLRKLAAVDPIEGLAVESAYVLLPAIVFLIWLETQGRGSFDPVAPARDALLMLGGVVTAMPLIWFAYGARRIPLSTVGIIQYLGPTLQLLTGVFVFGEAFPATRAIGFACIWAALAIYALDGMWRLRLRGQN